MPFSCAFLRRRTDRSSLTSPHQPVETVQTPKPISETSMSVLPSLRYFISFLSFGPSPRVSCSMVTTFYRPPPCMFSQTVLPPGCTLQLALKQSFSTQPGKPSDNLTLPNLKKLP